MDPFGNDEIARLLRLKSYEQPPPAYFENFLHDFRRRQRDELLRRPLWRICFERAHGFAVQCNVGSLASYAAAVACAAVISSAIYQQPDTTQFAVGSSPIPSTTPANAEREFNLAPPAVARTFNAEAILLPIPLLPADLLRSDEFVPLKLELGITRRSPTAREIKVGLRKLTARVPQRLRLWFAGLHEPSRDRV
jgi:hypothetical protein